MRLALLLLLTGILTGCRDDTSVRIKIMEHEKYVLKELIEIHIRINELDKRTKDN